jgi:hypothetical protein
MCMRRGWKTGEAIHTDTSMSWGLVRRCGRHAPCQRDEAFEHLLGSGELLCKPRLRRRGQYVCTGALEPAVALWAFECHWLLWVETLAQDHQVCLIAWVAKLQAQLRMLSVSAQETG